MSSAFFTSAAVALCALSSTASIQNASPRLRVVPRGDALVLGRDEGTSVRITLNGATAAEGALPRIATSVGSLATVQPRRPGAWEVAYTTPEGKTPSVAILIAEIETSAGVVSGSAAIRLLGRARVSVETEKNARVRFKVANRHEGPFETGAAGLVETSITVPPGHSELEIITVDQAGNRSRRRKALAVQPFPMVAIGPAPSELVADGEHPLVVSVAAVSTRGGIVPFGGMCRTNRGKLTRLRPVGSLGRWQLDVATVGGGQAVMTCGIGRGKHEMATLRVRLLPGALQELAISGPGECATGQTCNLHIRARDRADNRVIHLDDLEATADVGELTMRATTRGAPVWAYVAPTTYKPGRTAKVRLAVASGPAAEWTIALSPAPLEELGFAATDARVDLGSELRIPVRAVDSFGNSVRLLSPPTLTADVGDAVWLGEGEGGPAVVYRSPKSADAEVDLLRISYGTLRAEMPMVLESGWRHSHLSARVGVLAVRNGLWGPALGFDVTSSVPPLDGRFSAALRVAGARSQSVSLINPTGDQVVGSVEQELWLVPFLGGVDALMIGGNGWDVSGGLAGGGLLLLTSFRVVPASVTDRGAVPADQGSTLLSPAASIHVRGALDLGPGHLELGVDILYAWTHGTESIRGDLLAFVATVGWRLGWNDALW
jgi:hypothetical protein